MGVFTEYLSAHYLTLAPDLRGYGRSRPSGQFELGDHLPDLLAVLDAYGIEQCFVLGWSLGGILGLELALRYPERVQGLVLIATAARPVGNHPPITWVDLAYTGLASGLNWLWPGHPWIIRSLGQRSLYRYLIQQHTPVAYRRIAREGTPAYLNTSNQANQALNRALRQGYNRLPALEHLSIPVLMLSGEQDFHITAAASLETADHLPDCEYHCYPDTAHLFPWEIPQIVLNDIGTWLNHHVPT